MDRSEELTRFQKLDRGQLTAYQPRGAQPRRSTSDIQDAPLPGPQRPAAHRGPSTTDGAIPSGSLHCREWRGTPATVHKTIRKYKLETQPAVSEGLGNLPRTARGARAGRHARAYARQLGVRVRPLQTASKRRCQKIRGNFRRSQAQFFCQIFDDAECQKSEVIRKKINPDF